MVKSQRKSRAKKTLHTLLLRRSPRRKSPRRKSPRRRLPLRRSPLRRSPLRRSPLRRSPRRRSPLRRSQRRRSPRRRSPLRRSPRRRSPLRRSPLRRSTKYNKLSKFNKKSAAADEPEPGAEQEERCTQVHRDRIEILCPVRNFDIRDAPDCLGCSDEIIALDTVEQNPVCINNKCYDKDNIRRSIALDRAHGRPPLDPASRQEITDPDGVLVIDTDGGGIWGESPHPLDDLERQEIQEIINNSGVIDRINAVIEEEMLRDVTGESLAQFLVEVTLRWNETLVLYNQARSVLSLNADLVRQEITLHPEFWSQDSYVSAIQRQRSASADAWGSSLTLRVAAAQMLAFCQRMLMVSLARGMARRMANRDQARAAEEIGGEEGGRGVRGGLRLRSDGGRGMARQQAYVVDMVTAVPEGFTTQVSAGVREAATAASADAERMATREAAEPVGSEEGQRVVLEAEEVAMNAIRVAREAVSTANQAMFDTAGFILDLPGPTYIF